MPTVLKSSTVDYVPFEAIGYHGTLKKCESCGRIIGWRQSKRGRWYPVDVVFVGGRGCMIKFVQSGGFVPWHTCNSTDIFGKRIRKIDYRENK